MSWVAHPQVMGSIVVLYLSCCSCKQIALICGHPAVSPVLPGILMLELTAVLHAQIYPAQCGNGCKRCQCPSRP